MRQLPINFLLASKKWLPLLICSLFFFGCQKTPPKVYPLQYEEDEFWRISQERGQERLKRENENIQTFIRVSKEDFELNKSGIWISRIEVENPRYPQEGDVVKYGLQVRSIMGDVIYSFAENGEKTLVLGKQKTTRGLLTALKNTPLNSTSKALVPSTLAHGTYGDTERIGANETLVYEIKLNEIQKDSR